MQFTGQAGRRHTLQGSAFSKDDTHRELATGQPWGSFRDRWVSAGVMDTILLGEWLTVVAGFSADRLSALNAEDLQAGQTTPFPRSSRTAINGQAGLFHTLGGWARLCVTFARKTRLPTMKDRYSCRLGRAIPDPGIGPENVSHWETGVSRLFGRRMLADAALFWSELGGLVQPYCLQPNLFQLRNAGDARYRGAEFSLRGTAARAIVWEANYTYLDRKFLSPANTVLAEVPGHRGLARLSCTPVARVGLQATLQGEAGRQYQNDAGRTGRVPGLGVTVRLLPKADFQFGVQNAGDRHYFLSEGYPEAGRTFYGKLRFRL